MINMNENSGFVVLVIISMLAVIIPLSILIYKLFAFFNITGWFWIYLVGVISSYIVRTAIDD